MASKLKSLLKKGTEKNIHKQFYFHHIFQSKFAQRFLSDWPTFLYVSFLDFRFLNFDKIDDVIMILHELNYTLL